MLGNFNGDLMNHSLTCLCVALTYIYLVTTRDSINMEYKSNNEIYNFYLLVHIHVCRIADMSVREY